MNFPFQIIADNISQFNIDSFDFFYNLDKKTVGQSKSCFFPIKEAEPPKRAVVSSSPIPCGTSRYISPTSPSFPDARDLERSNDKSSDKSRSMSMPGSVSVHSSVHLSGGFLELTMNRPVTRATRRLNVTNKTDSSVEVCMNYYVPCKSCA